jgi:putative transposase
MPQQVGNAHGPVQVGPAGARRAQRFLAAHDQINTIFRPRRYRLSSASYRHARSEAFDLWDDYALEMTA